MAQKTVKIKLSGGSVQFKRNTPDGIEVTVHGQTKNGKGKWHEIVIFLDQYDMENIVVNSKNWARTQVDNANTFLNKINDNSDQRR